MGFLEYDIVQEARDVLRNPALLRADILEWSMLEQMTAGYGEVVIWLPKMAVWICVMTATNHRVHP